MSREVCGICGCPYDDITGDCACPPPSVQKSTLREAAALALEALEWNYNTDLDNIPACEQWAEMLKKNITALRAALAEPDTCTWWQDGDSDSGMYQTSCRRYFDLNDGTPEDNKMRWCCYCGKRLVQELIEEHEDE